MRPDFKQIRGVGIGSPGSVDEANGRIVFAGNLGWKRCRAEKGFGKTPGRAVFLQTIAAPARSGCMRWNSRANRKRWWASSSAPASAVG